MNTTKETGRILEPGWAYLKDPSGLMTLRVAHRCDEHTECVAELNADLLYRCTGCGETITPAELEKTRN